MTVTLYQYPKCSTCRKAAKWLEQQGIAYTSVHLVEATPEAPVLQDLWSRSGLPLKKLFNTAGQSYRAGNWKDRLASTSDDDALASLASDGMLIKRPLLDVGNTVLVGFREDAYRDALTS